MVPVPVAVAIIIAGIVAGSAAGFTVVRFIIARRARRRADLSRLLSEISGPDKAADLQRTLDQVRLAGPKTVAPQAERIVSLLADPEASEQDIERARADFIAAARTALTRP